MSVYVLNKHKKPLMPCSEKRARLLLARAIIVERIEALGLPVETASGGRTKFNRVRLGVPKAHGLDAACAEAVADVQGWNKPTLVVAAMGRGQYQRMLPDGFGFPRGHRPRTKLVHGFQTGDLVRADVPAGKKKGLHFGRVAVRSTGNFNVKTATETAQGLSHKHCRIAQRAGGFAFGLSPTP